MDMFLKILDCAVSVIKIMFQWICGFSTFITVLIIASNQFFELYEKFKMSGNCTWVAYAILFCAFGVGFVVANNLFSNKNE